LVIIAGFLFAGVIYFDNYKAKKVDISEMAENDGSIQFKLESVNNEANNDYINIEGWALKKGSNLSTVECYVALRNTSTNECYKVNTAMKERIDITIQMNDGFKYDKCGFYASFLKSILKNGKYEITLLYQSDNNDIIVPTGEMISINR